jgi:hypothetical protein
MLLTLTACVRDSGPSASDLQGFWVLESLEVAGVEIQVEVGVNAARTPWVEIGDLLSGSLGCNDFREFSDAPYVVSDGVLIPGEMMFTAMLCSAPDGTGDVMMIERMLQGAMSRSRAGFQVKVVSSGMAWVEGDTRLVFSRVTGPPSGPPIPPEPGLGRLDCLPGVMVRESLPDTGDGEQILRAAVPNVVTVQTDPPGWFWWGYDASGAVVAAVAKGDIVPVIYELFTCTGA